MYVVNAGKVPIYECTCYECHSTLRFIRSEMDGLHFIHCPLCGTDILIGSLIPITDDKI